MIYEEIYKNYKNLFIILVEKVGRETGNSSYQRVGELLEEPNFIKKMESKILEDELPLKLVVCIFITAVFIDIYNIETLHEWDEIKSYDKLQEFYNLYLRLPTIQFCSKYGIETFTETEFNFKVIKWKNQD